MRKSYIFCGDSNLIMNSVLHFLGDWVRSNKLIVVFCSSLCFNDVIVTLPPCCSRLTRIYCNSVGIAEFDSFCLRTSSCFTMEANRLLYELQ
jgi:hypothetical protein